MTRIGPALMVVGAIAMSATAQSPHPHLDTSEVTGGCQACHEGHGASRSPMLPKPQMEMCLDCHGNEARAQEQVDRERLALTAKPTIIGTELEKLYTHPISPEAFSRSDPNAVTCSSCHSPHRGSLALNQASDQASRAPEGRQRLSSADPNQLEYELCEGCHGMEGVTTQDISDLSRMTNPNNASAHPIEAPAQRASPSTREKFSGKEVNCTDCHGNSDPDGPRGPHGSEFKFILTDSYVTADGSEESAEAYGLCYRCHRRREVLDSPLFPLHRLHVVDQRASCATCHSSHGSIENRALIRFGEQKNFAEVTQVAPSMTTGETRFVSTQPGVGTCSLTCHGYDHANTPYGRPSGVLFSGPSGAVDIFGAPRSTGGQRDRIIERARPEERPETKRPD